MKEYIKPTSTIIEINIDFLLANSVTNISPADPLSNSTTTVINGGIVGDDVSSGTISADSKIDLWTWEK